jgi:hypothetical protein
MSQDSNTQKSDNEQGQSFSKAVQDLIIKDPIVSEVFNDGKKLSVLESSKVSTTINAVFDESFDAHGKGEMQEYVYWANAFLPKMVPKMTPVMIEVDGSRVHEVDDKGNPKYTLARDAKGSTIHTQELDKEGHHVFIHHGNVNARQYEWDNTNRAVMMSSLEGGKIQPLDEVESDPTLTVQQKRSICALSSFAYARNARGTVTTFVQGANSNSFFRTTELVALMNNSNVHSIKIGTEDLSKPIDGDINRGTKQCEEYSKMEGYHNLREGWVDSAIQRYNDCKRQYDDFNEARKRDANIPENLLYHNNLKSAIEGVASEVGLVQHMINPQNKYPFRKGVHKDNDDSPEYTVNDRKLEQGRLNKLNSILPDLRKDMDLINDVEQKRKSNSVTKSFDQMSDEYKNKLDKSEMNDVEKIVYTAFAIGQAVQQEGMKRDVGNRIKTFSEAIEPEIPRDSKSLVEKITRTENIPIGVIVRLKNFARRITQKFRNNSASIVDSVEVKDGASQPSATDRLPERGDISNVSGHDLSLIHI